MTSLDFGEEETEKIKDTLEVYIFVKELLIYNEIIDPNSNTFPQILNELRNAYDHLNRVLIEKLELDEVARESDYSIKTLDKVLGHVYRAAYDALDWLNVNIVEDINEELKPFSRESIRAVVPEYYRDIRPKLPKYERKISKLRMDKDIISINSVDLIEYTNIVKE